MCTTSYPSTLVGQSKHSEIGRDLEGQRMTWHPVLSREQSTMADTWTEYLCASPSKDGFVLGICVHELLGYIPQEWFDDDGEPLPEFRGDDGCLKLPAEYEGRSLECHDGECLFGQLDQWNNDNSATVTELSLVNVREALNDINWSTEDSDEVLAALLIMYDLYE